MKNSLLALLRSDRLGLVGVNQSFILSWSRLSQENFLCFHGRVAVGKPKSHFCRVLLLQGSSVLVLFQGRVALNRVPDSILNDPELQLAMQVSARFSLISSIQIDPAMQMENFSHFCLFILKRQFYTSSKWQTTLLTVQT